MTHRKFVVNRGASCAPEDVQRVDPTTAFHESRRSTRVPLKVVITVEAGAESQRWDGETLVVNLQAALIASGMALGAGMRVSIHGYVTEKRAAARFVYIDPENPLRCGIELAEPQ